MGFQEQTLQHPIMRAPGRNRLIPNTFWRAGAASLVLCLFGGSFLALADTSLPLGKAKVGTCYCRCPESQKRTFCVKMCDSARYAASHPWATRCVKPRLNRPAEEHDAGPRYPHPGRAERAQDKSNQPSHPVS
jgi:hypothetical protein